MIDMVFVVDDAVDWHTENLSRNRDHYSALKHLGPKTITRIQESMASGVYYNPFIKMDGILLKYGVISTNTLEKDLNGWTKIYIAGRLHKPVLELRSPASRKLVQSLRYNRETALRAVLLQEGRYFTKFSLYHGITELSYLGDSRMKMAENPEKTKNIVTPLVNEFDKIYLPLLHDLQPIVQLNEEGMLIQDTTPQMRFKHLMALPTPLQINLSRQMFRDPRLFDIEETMAELSYRPSIRNFIRNSISEVVWSSSIRQTLQGLLTAGVKKSVQYAFEKLKKGRASKVQEIDVETEIFLPNSDGHKAESLLDANKKLPSNPLVPGQSVATSANKDQINENKSSSLNSVSTKFSLKPTPSSSSTPSATITYSANPPSPSTSNSSSTTPSSTYKADDKIKKLNLEAELEDANLKRNNRD